MTQGVAQEGGVGVRDIDPRAQPQGTADRLGVGATHVEQRADEVAGDRLDPGQSVEPPAAHQREQHRLGAVVHRVPERLTIRPDPLGHLPGRAPALVPSPVLDRRALGRWPEGRGDVALQPVRFRATTDVRRVGRRSSAQPVVEVEHREPDAEEATHAHEHLEQAHGVRPTRDPHEDELTGREEIVCPGGVRDALDDTGDRRGPALHGAIPRRGRSSDRDRRSRQAAAGSRARPTRG